MIKTLSDGTRYITENILHEGKVKGIAVYTKTESDEELIKRYKECIKNAGQVVKQSCQMYKEIQLSNEFTDEEKQDAHFLLEAIK